MSDTFTAGLAMGILVGIGIAIAVAYIIMRRRL